jgi:recombination associated protein RdgC
MAIVKSKNFPTSVSLYTMKEGFEFDLDAMAEQLPSFAFSPCLPEDGRKIGFVPPVGDVEFVHRLAKGAFWLSLKSQEKQVPATEVNRLLLEKTDKILKEEERIVRGGEKLTFKTEIILALRVTAMSQFKTMHMMAIPSHRLLCVFGAGADDADSVTRLLRGATDSLPIAILEVAALNLKAFFNKEIASAMVKPLGKVRLKNQSSEKAQFDSSDWDEGATIRAMLEDGFAIESLDASLSNVFAFTVSKEMKVSGLKWSEAVTMQADDSDARDYPDMAQADADRARKLEEMAADYLMVQDSFICFVDSVLPLFGGAKPFLNKKTDDTDATASKESE